jgi:hypothetical protein
MAINRIKEPYGKYTSNDCSRCLGDGKKSPAPRHCDFNYLPIRRALNHLHGFPSLHLICLDQIQSPGRCDISDFSAVRQSNAQSTRFVISASIPHAGSDDEICSALITVCASFTNSIEYTRRELKYWLSRKVQDGVKSLPYCKFNLRHRKRGAKKYPARATEEDLRPSGDRCPC